MSLFEISGGTQQRNWMKECDFQLIRHPNELFDIADSAGDDFGHDLETDSLNPEKCRIVGYSGANGTHKGFYYPVSHTVGSDLNLPIGPVIEVIKKLDQRALDRNNPKILDPKNPKAKPFHNVWYNYTGFDGEILFRNTGYEMQSWEDAFIAVYLENTNWNVYGLKDTAMRMLGIEMITFEELTQGRTFDMIHPEDATPYAASDAAVTLRLWRLPKVQQALLPGNLHELGQQFIYNLEKQVSYVLREGMQYKVWLDPERLEKLFKETERKVKDLEAEIHELAGGPFDIQSSVALGKKLTELGIRIKETTRKTGQIETKKEVLEKYKRDHPIIPKTIQWKELSTQNRNYIGKLIACVNHFGPLVRFQFQHIGVPTGRMKSGGSGKGTNAYDKGVADVNVQSLPDPHKQKYLPNIRSAFVANDPRTNSKEWCLVSIDYSQMELRIAGNLSREKSWIEEYSKPNSDIHKRNAELAYRRKLNNVDTDKTEKALRDRGKTISFAILYGGDAYTVANNAGISVEQGQVLVENFFAGARDLKSWIDGWIRAARIKKFVKTYFGRIRHLDEFYVSDKQVPDARVRRRLWAKGDREAVNDPIQGGAADIFKIACVKVKNLIKEKGWQNDCQHIIYMHDELLFRMRVSMLELIVPEIQKVMEFEVKYWPIKLTTDVEVGWDWGIMYKLKDFVQSIRNGVHIQPVTDSDDEVLSEEESIYSEELAESMKDYGYRN